VTLGEKQRLFTINIGRLILWAYEQGYELTLSEAYRTPEQAELNAKAGKGIANSLHTQRLAVDLNLFRGGRWLQFSEQHRPLGDYWKTLHPLNRWGGDFRPRPDGNHYSMEHEGVK
jgi:hypothetical protein